MFGRYRFHRHPFVVGAQLIAISTFASALVLDVPSLEASMFVSSICMGIIILVSLASAYFRNEGEAGVCIGATPLRVPVVLDDEDLLGGVRLAGTAGTDDIARTIAAAEIELGKGLVLVDGRGSDETRAAVIDAARRSGRTDEVVVLDFADGRRRGTHTISTLAGLSDEALCRVILGLRMRRSTFRDAMISSLRMNDADTRMFAYALVGISATGRRAGEIEPDVALRWPSLEELVRAAQSDDARAAKIREYLDGLPGFAPERGEDQRRDLVDLIEGMRQGLDQRLKAICNRLDGPFFPQGIEVDLGRHLRDGRIVHVVLPPDEDRIRDAIVESILVEQSFVVMEDVVGRRGSVVGIDLPERWSHIAQALRRPGWGIVRDRDRDGRPDSRILISTRCEIAIPGIDARMLGRLRPGRAVMVREGARPREFAVARIDPSSTRNHSMLPPVLFVEGGMAR